jgi:tRNA G18 (ribose-2'-O)-methylase SpoU
MEIMEIQEVKNNMEKVKMKQNGFFGIGVMNMKYPINYGTLFRTAQVFGADFLFLIGKQFTKQYSDSMNSFKHIPLYEYETFDEFYKNLPYKSKLIGIEIVDSAIPIKGYKHPRQACYLLGGEKDGLSQEAIEKCDEIVYLPGERSLNVSVAGSIVIFDRIIKK